MKPPPRTPAGSSRVTDPPLSTRGNLLLRSLPEAEIARLRPHLKVATTRLGEELHCRRDSDPDVFFPVDTVSALVLEGPDGSGVEVASVGHEGMVGLPAFVDSEIVDFKAFTQVAGTGFRMPRRILKRELAANGKFAEHLDEYTEVLLLCVGQSAFCGRKHRQLERCARWLLSIHDRVPRREFAVTQEFLAQMLGVRRATVTEAVQGMKKRGFISTVRGSLRILDPEGLRSIACDCYRSIRSEFDALKREWNNS
ncbi:MAG: Crp/Fnr family transcriptional regulator [Acidobacteriota bacterium]|nr:Crp/Fnr family transcriptional regulator [Acidobacteriota bacterium]